MTRSLPLLCVLLASAGAAPAQRRWSGGGLPVANYDADAGFGFGGLGSLALRTRAGEPYRARFQLQLFFTTEGVQGHELRWDVRRAGHPRLHLFGQLGYFSTVNATYCGVGSQVTCAGVDAEAAASAAGLAPDTGAWDDFVRHYYLMRLIDPTGQVGARWQLSADGRVSLFAQWRASYYRSGTLGTRGPYPGSLYSQDLPGGETGLVSVPQVGIMYDSRDFEPAPACGVFLEASLRGAAAATGSQFDFAGGNLTARTFATPWHGFTAATRLVADLAAGELPVAELGLVNAAETYVAFGGQSLGRGVRERRFIGRLKLLAQEEARVTLSRRWVLVGFIDAGWISADWEQRGSARLVASGGAGLRVVVDPTFILRADLGLSSYEGYAPQPYLYLGHVF